MRAAQRGKARIVLVFASNFSESLQMRVTDPRHADDGTIMSSAMEAHLDDTGKNILRLQFFFNIKITSEQAANLIQATTAHRRSESHILCLPLWSIYGSLRWTFLT